MAARYEREESARIKVHVLSTFLPLNLPLHVDPFWMLVKYTEANTIRDVESKLLSYLNTFANDCPLELAVHSGQITPSWTYLPEICQNITRQRGSCFCKNNIVTTQELTTILRPASYGSKSNFTCHRQFMTYSISHTLPIPSRLVFKEKFMMMDGCILLNSSNSEILRDGDIITISTVCDVLSQLPNGCETEGTQVLSSPRQVESDLDVEDPALYDFMNKLSEVMKDEVGRSLEKLEVIHSSLSTRNPKEASNYRTKKSRKRKSSSSGRKEVNDRNSDDRVISTDANDTSSFSPVGKKKLHKQRNDFTDVITEMTEKDRNDFTASSLQNLGNTTLNSNKKEGRKSHQQCKGNLLSTMNGNVNAQTVCDTNCNNSHTAVCNDKQSNKMSKWTLDNANNKKKNTVTDGSSHDGVSEYLQSLIKQRRNEICSDQKKKSDNEEKRHKKVCENTVKEKSDQHLTPGGFSTSEASHQSDSPVVSLKKKSRRRQKKKKNAEESSPAIVQPKPRVTDFTMKLPDNQKPRNSRITFDYNSDDEPDVPDKIDGSLKNISESDQSTKQQLQHGSSHIHKTSDMKTLQTIDSSTMNCNMGNPIDPSGKFHALLNQRAKTSRQFETFHSTDGHTVVRNSRSKPGQTQVEMSSGRAGKDVETNDYVIPDQSPGNSFDDDTPAQLTQHRNREETSVKVVTTPTEVNHISRVEVTPLYMDYEKCENLTTLPRKGDTIAYKILELSEDYTPIVSGYKEAAVISVDPDKALLELELRGETAKTKREGRFELIYEDSDDDVDMENEENETMVSVNFADLMAVRLVCRANEAEAVEVNYSGP